MFSSILSSQALIIGALYPATDYDYLASPFRFKVEQMIDMKNILQELGIKKIFTNDADLSAMTGDK